MSGLAQLLDQLLAVLHPNATAHYSSTLWFWARKELGSQLRCGRPTIMAMREPRGVIYAMAPSASASAFLNRLATATKFRKPVSFFAAMTRAIGSTGNVAATRDLWDSLEEKLLEGSWLAKYGRPPTGAGHRCGR